LPGLKKAKNNLEIAREVKKEPEKKDSVAIKMQTKVWRIQER
jgi:hypothetical protein